MREPLLILGASARAAAFSAQRAGFAPLAADMFADSDLEAVCPVTKVTDYPAGLEEAARRSAPASWIYCGALENYPDLVDRIAQLRPLLGNPGSKLREVRHPFKLVEAFSDDGLPCPQVRRWDDLPRVGEWLQKPLRSSAGHAVQFFDAAKGPGQTIKSSQYFQQFIDGEPCAAVYLAAGGRAMLLGVTRQLIGTNWLGASGFRYAGSLGPIQLNETCRTRFEQLGNCLACRFDLIGLFGVDVIMRDDEVWPVEVNPRYTASIELLERAFQIDVIALHVEACRRGTLPNTQILRDDSQLFGKAIKFTTADTVVSQAGLDFAYRCNEDSQWPIFADLPFSGTVIKHGQPFATAFATGDSFSGVESRLQELWRRLFACIDEP